MPTLTEAMVMRRCLALVGLAFLCLLPTALADETICEGPFMSPSEPFEPEAGLPTGTSAGAEVFRCWIISEENGTVDFERAAIATIADETTGAHARLYAGEIAGSDWDETTETNSGYEAQRVRLDVGEAEALPEATLDVARGSESTPESDTNWVYAHAKVAYAGIRYEITVDLPLR